MHEFIKAKGTKSHESEQYICKTIKTSHSQILLHLVYLANAMVLTLCSQ